MRLMEREDFRMKENKMSRRSFLKAGAFASAAGMLAAAPAAANAAAPNAAKAAEEENGLLGVFGGRPKYVFLFIGDGMGTAQIQSARFYKGTVENNGAVVEGELSFTQFPEVGSVTTYDSTSFCPDSASTATSIATGHKTESGVINMCPWTRDVPYKTIAEKLHTQKGYKVGVISTVNIDHATPAAFYAHQKTRKNYYEIGVELANSGFEYFAGGEFQKVQGDGTGPDNHAVAASAGYNVVTTQADAAALVPLDQHRHLAPLLQSPGQMKAHLAAAHNAHPRPLRLFPVGLLGRGGGFFGGGLPPGVRVGFCQKGVRRQLGGAHQLQPEALAVHPAAGRVHHPGNGLGHPKQLLGHLSHHQVYIVLPGHGQHRAAALYSGLMQGVCINGRAVNGRPVKALLHQFFQRLAVPVQHGDLMASGPQGRHQSAAGTAAAHDENIHMRSLSGRAGSARRGILLPLYPICTTWQANRPFCAGSPPKTRFSARCAFCFSALCGILGVVL